MKYTNQDLRNRFAVTHTARNQRGVNARRRVSEMALALAVELNEMLMDGDDKNLAIWALEEAHLRARKSMDLEGLNEEWKDG